MVTSEDLQLDKERLAEVEQILSAVVALEQAEDREGRRYQRVRQELAEVRAWLEAVRGRYGYTSDLAKS
jgi:cation transport regulator ChaB